MTVLFVCTGNVCRSPMAEVFLRQYAEERGLDIDVESAGTHGGSGGASENARAAVKDVGLSLDGFRSALLDEEVIERVDKIVPLTVDHGRFIETLFPGSKGKVLYLRRDVSDPYGWDVGTYKKCFNEIQELIKEINWEEI